jgi:hypothetical protein
MKEHDKVFSRLFWRLFALLVVFEAAPIINAVSNILKIYH